jgi:peptidoglycan/LPS O-acetylase OafA/YrhL
MSATAAVPSGEVSGTATPPSSSPGAMAHIPSLDGLRGLAVIGVLLFHAGYLTGGFLGVDLFFALSGFLITRLLVREADRTRTIDLIGFWGRRFRRLLPAVLVLLVAVMLWARWFGSPDQWATTLNDGPWAQFYLANWHQIGSDRGYWESFADPPLLGHLWSLAIEEQFYVVWPLVAALVWRFTRRGHDVLLAVCLGGAALSFAVMLALFDGGDPTRVYMGTDTRASSILIGAALGTRPAVAWVNRAVQARPHIVDLVMVVAIGIIATMWITIDGASSAMLFRGGLLVHSGLAAIVVAFAAVRLGWVTRLLGTAVLQWFGRLSYSLYLWHWPVYAVLNTRRTGLDGLELLAVRVAVSIAFALASYHLVEVPLRRKASWTHGSAGRWAFVGAMGAVAMLWVITPAPVTEVARFDPGSITAPSLPPGTTSPDASTTSPTVPQPLPVARTVLWDGDSLAYDEAPAVVAALQAAGVTVVDISNVGQRLTPYDDGRDPLERFNEGFDAAPANQPVDLVVHQLTVWDASADPASQLVALENLAALTAARGARLVLVTAPVVTPELAAPRTDDLVASARRLADASDGQVVVLDQSGVLGDEFVEDLDGDGVPERKPDGVHVCPSGAARVAAWLVQELAMRFDGVDAVLPSAWVEGVWAQDSRFDDPPGACMAR